MVKRKQQETTDDCMFSYACCRGGMLILPETVKEISKKDEKKEIDGEK